MAGLCAARELAERSTVSTSSIATRCPAFRSPAARCPRGGPHLPLVSGARLLEGWFPGIVDELEAGGALDVDLTRDLYWHPGGGPSRRPVRPARPVHVAPVPGVDRPAAGGSTAERGHPGRSVRRWCRRRRHRCTSHQRAARRRRGDPLRPRRGRHRAPGPEPGLDRGPGVRGAGGVPRRHRHPLHDPALPPHRTARPRLEGGGGDRPAGQEAPGDGPRSRATAGSSSSVASTGRRRRRAGRSCSPTPAPSRHRSSPR